MIRRLYWAIYFFVIGGLERARTYLITDDILRVEGQLIAPRRIPNIHHVEIKVAPNPDPNRVAKRTAEILMELQKEVKS